MLDVSCDRANKKTSSGGDITSEVNRGEGRREKGVARAAIGGEMGRGGYKKPGLRG